MTFQQLDIIAPILKAIDEEGYQTPSPIQTEAMPIILAGHDLLASAQTGTGKTAAFAIPIIQMIHANKVEGDARKIKSLVLAPTRELAEQIKDSFRTYAGKLDIKTGAIYGGASQRGQEVMLKKGIDILVATPGRLIDLMKQKVVSLSDVHYFVLDEADTMLDMGFIKDVKHIKGFIAKTRQTLMFSATISPEVIKLAGDLLVAPQTLEMAPPEKMIDKINHSLFYVEKKQKFELLLDLLVDPKLESVLVFTRTKHGANRLVKDLVEYGVKVDAIHGNKSQSARQNALNDFKSKKNRVLVATDIAARGIDIDDLSHVINYDLPESAETYVHRIGRTGRRGLSGEAYTFCSQAERALLKAIEKHTGLKLTVLDLKPVSEDSKFKRVVVADDQTKSKIDTNKLKDTPKNRRYVGEGNPGKYKAKVEKKAGRRELVDTAPANFGKRQKVSKDKKKFYNNISEQAFEDLDKINVKEKRKSRIEEATRQGATRSYAKKTGGRTYTRDEEVSDIRQIRSGTDRPHQGRTSRNQAPKSKRYRQDGQQDSQNNRSENKGENKTYGRAYQDKKPGYKGKKSFGRPNNARKDKTPFVEFGDGPSRSKKSDYRGKKNDFGAPKKGDKYRSSAAKNNHYQSKKRPTSRSPKSGYSPSRSSRQSD